MSNKNNPIYPHMPKEVKDQGPEVIARQKWFLRLFLLAVIFGFFSGIVGGMVVNSSFFDNWFWGEGGAWKPLVIDTAQRQDTKQLSRDNLMRKSTAVTAEIYLNSDVAKDGLFVPSQKISSGFFLTSDGYLATNKNLFVKYNKKDLVIVDQDHKVYQISKVINDPVSNLAIIKVEGNNFSSAPFIFDNDILADMDVYLPIPLIGLYPAKVLSANALIPQTKSDYYFSSESVYRFGLLKNGFGKSDVGSPLLNGKGELVGMLIGQTEVGGQIDKFLKASVIKTALSRALDKGIITRSYLGVHFQEGELNINLRDKLKRGIILINDPYKSLMALEKQSPLIQAGLKAGDVILEIEGESLSSWNTLPDILLDYSAGTKIKIKYSREKEEKIVEVVLGLVNSKN